ncbi:MAG: hypothetical protein A2Y71_06270 [Bacteroidetes bacterium RBG_13_42_15]|nr:MAG: hypothetical protein A2Y71_06270 [Bacteroidetes bacterium RBG_13_42_15]
MKRVLYTILLLLTVWSGSAQVSGQFRGGNNGQVRPSVDPDRQRAGDNVAPAVDSSEVGRVADDSIYLFFGESLNEDSVPATTAFSVTGPYGSPAVSAVTVAGDTVIIRLASDTYYGDTVEVSYIKPESNPLQDARGNQTASWSGDTATNNVGFVTAYQTVYDAFTTKPSVTQSRYYNRRVKQLVDGGYWARIDIFRFYANHINSAGEAVVNWKNPALYAMTLFNAPTHTPDQGILFNGTTQYGDNNWVPSVSGVNFTQNSASQILYIRTNVSANKGYGTQLNADNKDYYIYPSSFAGNAVIKTNDATNVSIANANGSGLYINTRTAAAVNKLYRNGTAIINGTTASIGVPTHSPYVGAYNDDNVAAGFRADQVAIECWGSGFSEADVIGITTILEAWMDDLGTGVIP